MLRFLKSEVLLSKLCPLIIGQIYYLYDFAHLFSIEALSAKPVFEIGTAANLIVFVIKNNTLQ
jgi:hypothetical protein